MLSGYTRWTHSYIERVLELDITGQTDTRHYGLDGNGSRSYLSLYGVGRDEGHPTVSIMDMGTYQIQVLVCTIHRYLQ